jgi:hypothetical protein
MLVCVKWTRGVYWLGSPSTAGIGELRFPVIPAAPRWPPDLHGRVSAWGPIGWPGPLVAATELVCGPERGRRVGSGVRVPADRRRSADGRLLGVTHVRGPPDAAERSSIRSWGTGRWSWHGPGNSLQASRRRILGSNPSASSPPLFGPRCPQLFAGGGGVPAPAPRRVRPGHQARHVRRMTIAAPTGRLIGCPGWGNRAVRPPRHTGCARREGCARGGRRSGPTGPATPARSTASILTVLPGGTAQSGGRSGASLHSRRSE